MRESQPEPRKARPKGQNKVVGKSKKKEGEPKNWSQSGKGVGKNSEGKGANGMNPEGEGWGRLERGGKAWKRRWDLGAEETRPIEQKGRARETGQTNPA